MKGGAYRRERSRRRVRGKSFSSLLLNFFQTRAFQGICGERKETATGGIGKPTDSEKRGSVGGFGFWQRERAASGKKSVFAKEKIDFVYKKSAEIDSVSREENPTDSEKTESVGLFIVYRDYITFFAVVKRALPTFFRFRKNFSKAKKADASGRPVHLS